MQTSVAENQFATAVNRNGQSVAAVKHSEARMCGATYVLVCRERRRANEEQNGYGESGPNVAAHQTVHVAAAAQATEN